MVSQMRDRRLAARTEIRIAVLRSAGLLDGSRQASFAASGGGGQRRLVV